MPYKHETDKLKIPKEHDRRRKLTEHQRKQIKLWYGRISQRKLAQAFGVSRRLIQFIGDPEKYQKNLLMRADRGGSAQYYNKNKHKAYMKNHRKYKQGLYLLGKLGGEHGQKN